MCEPEAIAVHLKDVDVMSEAVEQCAGQPLRAKHGCPFVERQIAGDDRGAALVALREDLEQQFGPGRRQRHVAEFINDQQLITGKLALNPKQPLLVTSLKEFVDQRRRRDEADRKPLLAGSEPKAECDVAFAGARVADRDDVLAVRRSLIAPVRASASC